MSTIHGSSLRLKQICVGVFGIAALIIGCDDEESPPPDGDQAAYASPTAPESLLFNLQESYRRREIDEYAKLLAPEFMFKFQPVDQNEIGKEFWSYLEDSIGTGALLTSPVVSEIRISLLNQVRDSTVNFPDTPLDSLKIRVLTTNLQVDQTDGITWVVTDPQDFYFRKGLPGYSEDSNRWFIYQWHDLPSLASPRSNLETWGRLKSRYRN